MTTGHCALATACFAETHDLLRVHCRLGFPSKLDFMFVANQSILIYRISTIPLRLSLPTVALQLYHLPLRARRQIRQINLTVVLYFCPHLLPYAFATRRTTEKTPFAIIFPWRIANLNTTAIKNHYLHHLQLGTLPTLSLLSQET